LNPKSRFKFILELIASKARKCIKFVAPIGPSLTKMTERFLKKQTTNLIAGIDIMLVSRVSRHLKVY